MPIFDQNPELLAAFRAGTPSALEQVYLAYVDDVVAIAQGGSRVFGAASGGTAWAGARVPGLRCPEDQRDFVHDVFAKAFAPAARARYRASSAYGPYLRTMARNLLIDRSRLKWTQTTTSLDPLRDPYNQPNQAAQVPTSTSIDAEAQLDRSRQATVLSAFLKQQSPQDQQFIALRFVQDLPQRQVADRLGWSRAKVRALEAECLKRMRRWLERGPERGPKKSTQPSAAPRTDGHPYGRVEPSDVS